MIPAVFRVRVHDPQRRYPILLTLLAQSAVDVLDDVVALFDQAVSARESRAKTKTDAELIERAKQGGARQLLMTEILPVLADPSIPDEENPAAQPAAFGTSSRRGNRLSNSKNFTSAGSVRSARPSLPRCAAWSTKASRSPRRPAR